MSNPEPKDDVTAAYAEGYRAGYKAAQEGTANTDCLPFTGICQPAKGNARIGAEDVYKAYPRKVGKHAALRAIDRAVRLMPGEGAERWEALLSRVQAYAKAVDTWAPSDRQFIPHPATWFNQGRFEDDPAEWGGETPSQFGKSH